MEVEEGLTLAFALLSMTGVCIYYQEILKSVVPGMMQVFLDIIRGILNTLP